MSDRFNDVVEYQSIMKNLLTVSDAIETRVNTFTTHELEQSVVELIEPGIPYFGEHSDNDYELLTAIDSQHTQQDSKPDLQLAEAMLNIRNGIEFIPVFSYFAKEIIYPLSKDMLPSAVANFNLPEVHSAILYARHIGASYVGAIALNLAAPFQAAVTASSSYTARLALKK